MSQENVEIVLRAYAAISQRDVAGLAELTHPAGVLDFSRSIGPQQGIYSGRQGLTEWLGAIEEAFESFEVLPVDFTVSGSRMVVRHEVMAKGRRSGLVLERVPEAAMVWELPDGKVLKATLFQNQREALEAVGLRA